MKKIIAVLSLMTVSAFAQFPSAVATDADMKVAANDLVTRLTQPVAAGDTVINLANATRVTVNMLLTIDPGTPLSEVVSVTAVNGGAVSVTRGFDKTTAVPHGNGRTVSGNITAYHFNQLSKQVQAIEQALGAGLTNLPRGTNLVVPADYDFATISPTGSLTAGVLNVVTLPVAPLGLSGTDRAHYIYVTGQGTPEAVLIGGGTCLSGGTNCTIFLTPANAHAAGFTITSATSGMQEAANALGPTGGTISLKATTYSPKAPIAVDHFRQFVGAGGFATKIIPASCSATVFSLLSQVEPPINGLYPIYNTANYGFKDFMIDGKGCAGQNTQIGIAALAGSDTTTGTLYFGIRLDTVIFNNVGEAYHLERVRDVVSSHVRAYSNTRFTITDTVAGKLAGTIGGFEVHFDDFVYRSGCYLSTDCGPSTQILPVIWFDGVEIASVRRAYMETQGVNIAATVGIRVSGFSENVVFDHVTMNSVGTALLFNSSLWQNIAFMPGHININNCAFDAIPTQAIRIADGVIGDFTNVHFVQVMASTFSNMYFFNGASQFGGTEYVYVGQNSTGISFVNCEWFSMRNLEIGLHVASSVNGLTVNSSVFANVLAYASTSTTGIAILLDPGAGSVDITHNQFPNIPSGNAVVDNSGPNPLKTIAFNSPIFTVASSTPAWQHVRISKVAGQWVSTEPLVPNVAAAAATTQFVYAKLVVGTTPLFISNMRIKTQTACTGVTSLLATVGSLGTSNFYLATAYDLKATVSNTNYAPLNGVLNGYGSATHVDDVLLYLSSTGGNLSAVADGCAVDIWLLVASLPN
jgi:hypothetical protein